MDNPGLKEDALRKILLVVFTCGVMAAFAPSLQADNFGQAFTGAATGATLGWMLKSRMSQMAAATSWERCGEKGTGRV